MLKQLIIKDDETSLSGDCVLIHNEIRSLLKQIIIEFVSNLC